MGGAVNAALVDFGQWLRAPRASYPALDIHSRRGATVVAWVKRLRKPGQHDWGEFIAGVWDEHGKCRGLLDYIARERWLVSLSITAPSRSPPCAPYRPYSHPRPCRYAWPSNPTLTA